ncbi:glycosyltransferase family 2 protein [Mucilaginibacter phyllosphaerae]|uniref:Glycosyltransferase family 2 protein n=1 Tax=Mucilaginibacter phyllosphaerae TaxID=1812349 RepID=A0A4Y8AGC3_9SPHI|nr:glycosyltransferase family A protein [Mucilaginibacter phyllosphaerae]MBB3968552.1 glycosyltransferase involved in cell wall biosynthesis [Mucilaginibacter phyllosphaerae]TEW67807.1 glycosyltransferase family 2 protein [Mucilaginibacter phyllosphaerae]GGH15285.1 hypothetical protein GCM10007352_23970 [Mucilaginibacter phyllosphaerae]
MTIPLVSIIIPVYNAEGYLAPAIQSALNQTWPSKQIIVVDDGSTDGSLAVARSFDNGMITVLSQPNKGAAAARNHGLKHATGQYIQFLDADDLLSPDKISAQMAVLNNRTEHLAVCSTIHFKDGDAYKNIQLTTEWFAEGSDDPVDFMLKLYAGNEVLPGYGGMIALHAWLTPKNLIDKAGGWNEQLSLDDDGEFFCRVALLAAGIKFSPAGLVYYRKFDHNRSLSAQKNQKSLESAIAATDLKFGYLDAKTGNSLIKPIFARHYWWMGVLAYPQFKTLYQYCINKAKQLGYNGPKYVGGPAGHLLTKYAGWKIARRIAYYKQSLKK